MLNLCFLGYLFREAEMRTVSEKTNGRVAWFSIMSLVMCIAVSGLQLWYLKRYFQKKNLYRLFNLILFVIQQTYNNLVKFL